MSYKATANVSPKPKPRLCNAIVDTKTGKLCTKLADYEVAYGFAGIAKFDRCTEHVRSLQCSMIRSLTALRPPDDPAAALFGNRPGADADPLVDGVPLEHFTPRPGPD